MVTERIFSGARTNIFELSKYSEYYLTYLINTLSSSIETDCTNNNFSLFQTINRMKGPIATHDPKLIEIIRKKYLIPPSREEYNFRLEQSSRNPYISSFLLKSIIKVLFSEYSGGFFVEAGALDGEYMSHTLELEQQHGWTVDFKTQIVYSMYRINYIMTS